MEKQTESISLSLACTHRHVRTGKIPPAVYDYIFTKLTWFCHLCGRESHITRLDYFTPDRGRDFRYLYPLSFTSELNENHWNLAEETAPLITPKPTTEKIQAP